MGCGGAAPTEARRERAQRASAGRPRDRQGAGRRWGVGAQPPRRRGVMDITAAYAECARITTREAKNFAYGIKLLDRPRRDAMSAVYAMARRIDDIGDGALPADRKLDALDAVRASIKDLSRPDDPVLVALADVVDRYAIPIDELGLLIDGCELDVRGGGFATFDDLVDYCRLVAGSI